MDEDKNTLQWQLKVLNQKQDLLKKEVSRMGDNIVRAIEAVNVTLKQSLELQKYIPLFKKVAQSLETLPTELEFHSKVLEEMFLTVDESKHRHKAMTQQAKGQLQEILEHISGTPLETAMRGMLDPEFAEQKLKKEEKAEEHMAKGEGFDIDRGLKQLFGHKPKLMRAIKETRDKRKQKEKVNG